jgi:hypothetical protein
MFCERFGYDMLWYCTVSIRAQMSSVVDVFLAFLGMIVMGLLHHRDCMLSDVSCGLCFMILLMG